MSIKQVVLKIPAVYWKVLYFVVAIIVCWIEAQGRSDFTIYKMASRDLVNGICPYSHSYIDGYYYYYSLFFAYLIYPFTLLSEFSSTFIWLMINAVLLYFIIIEIYNFLYLNQFDKEKRFLIIGLIILFSMRTIRENFHSAQVTILMLFLMLYSLKYLLQEKYLLSGLFLSLAINIKLLALPLMAYYLYRGLWKVVFWGCVFLVLLYFFPLIIMDKNFYGLCMHEWWALVNPSNDKHLIDVEERSFHSITTLITTLFMKNPPDIYALPIRRYIVDLSVEHVKWIIQLVRILLISSVILVIRQLPFQKFKNQYELFFEFSYVLALIPLIFPHQQHYAFLLQMPAIGILIYHWINGKIPKWMRAFLIAIFLCFNLKILLGVWNEYYDHFKILTYGGLLVIGLLIKQSFDLMEKV
ncbi:MAG: hypothetical protein KatS3mg027_2191 [Bacteroidia bacterium]|nr:MAG: hypothetical protein KatS3mg027_2191 [Bacteroidia bacterium]